MLHGMPGRARQVARIPGFKSGISASFALMFWLPSFGLLVSLPGHAGVNFGSSMAITTQVSVEVYCTPPRARCGYVNGVIEERPAAQSDHSTWQGCYLFLVRGAYTRLEPARKVGAPYSSSADTFSRSRCDGARPCGQLCPSFIQHSKVFDRAPSLHKSYADLGIMALHNRLQCVTQDVAFSAGCPGSQRKMFRLCSLPQDYGETGNQGYADRNQRDAQQPVEVELGHTSECGWLS